MILYMLSDIPESAFLHPNALQFTRRSLGVVSKAQQRYHPRNPSVTQEGMYLRIKQEPYCEHYVSGYAVTRDKIGVVCTARS